MQCFSGADQIKSNITLRWETVLQQTSRLLDWFNQLQRSRAAPPLHLFSRSKEIVHQFQLWFSDRNWLILAVFTAGGVLSVVCNPTRTTPFCKRGIDCKWLIFQQKKRRKLIRSPVRRLSFQKKIKKYEWQWQLDGNKPWSHTVTQQTGDVVLHIITAAGGGFWFCRQPSWDNHANKLRWGKHASLGGAVGVHNCPPQSFKQLIGSWDPRAASAC